MEVSIHAAQAGCDSVASWYLVVDSGFNSRSPSGLRRKMLSEIASTVSFNSRSPSGLRHAKRGDD